MSNLIDIFAETGANLIGDDSSPTFRVENASTGNVLDLRSLGSNAVILNAIASGASTAVIGLNGLGKSYVSTNSTATVVFAMRVAVAGTNNYWVPIYMGAA